MSAIPSPYLVIQNTPVPVLKPFSSLEELQKWATTELGSNSATQYEQARIELFRYIAVNATKIDDNPMELIRHPENKLYFEFRNHPDYTHYCALHILSESIFFKNEKYIPVLKDMVMKKTVYTQPSHLRFFTLKYDHFVNVLYKAFGKVLPELAFNIYHTLNDKTITHDVFKIDRKQIEIQLAQVFKDTFYRHSSDGVVKRTYFIDHISKRMNGILDELGLLDNPTNSIKNLLCSELFTSPEKLLGLTTIRRSAGMYIVCLERRDMSPTTLLGSTPEGLGNEYKMCSPGVRPKYVTDQKKENVLILGSGRYYGVTPDEIMSENSCIPPFFDKKYLENANITFLDKNPDVGPDIITDVTKEGWWCWADKDNIKFHAIVDMIGYSGSHINSGKYDTIFWEGIRHLIFNNGTSQGTLYGYY